MNGQPSVDGSAVARGPWRTAGWTSARIAEGVGPRLRSVLAGIPEYKPGRAAPVGDRTSRKLSTDENPYPPLPGVLDAAVAAAGQLNRYPDLTCAALTRALVEHLDVSTDHIVIGTGSI